MIVSCNVFLACTNINVQHNCTAISVLTSAYVVARQLCVLYLTLLETNNTTIYLTHGIFDLDESSPYLYDKKYISWCNVFPIIIIYQPQCVWGVDWLSCLFTVKLKRGRFCLLSESLCRSQIVVLNNSLRHKSGIVGEDLELESSQIVENWKIIIGRWQLTCQTYCEQIKVSF